MNSEIQALFSELADLAPSERAQYFERHQVTEQVRSEVEALLRFDSPQTDSITGIVAGTAEQFENSNVERFCGPYELIRLLGRGGMGSVHLAQRTDGEVDLRVAIKFVRAFHDRFLQERQILASLNHPGIARLLDAGHTATGQPYLVMEYVEGVPVDRYCRDLPLRDQLKLFLLVCDAIAYSHRNLVIHRDLKPSNILVEAGGKPKLLDFGIAKFLDDPTGPAATRERILTPEYASPEQIRGAAKTTSTDVYSLGVVLYKILTGRCPHVPVNEKESIEELICSADAIPPSRLNPSLPRDLNFVLAKALRKEPGERYSSVDAMAEDLQAVLESRPVKARAGDAWYRASKFVRRHWLPLSAVAAGVLCLAAGLFVANQQRVVAQQRFSQLRQFSNRMLRFDATIRALPGSTQARQELVSVSTEYLDGLSREVHDDLDLKLDLAHGYLATAQVEGVPIAPNLGRPADAKISLAKAAAQTESVLAKAPQRPDALLLAAEIEQDSMVVADSEADRTI